MCNFGTESKQQTIGLNNIISRVPYLSTLRDEVMFYPDKKKYDQYELTETYGDKNYKSVVVPYNEVWCLKNGKYQHLIQSRSFPKYHWDKTKLNELENIGVDPRGNFYYPAGGFREWHSNRLDMPGYRVYFVACEKDNKSGLNYIHPVTDTVKTLYDKNETANIFYVMIQKKTFFHSVKRY